LKSRKLFKKPGFTFKCKKLGCATYVEKQAADIGFGFDVITELRSDVLELLDLGLGKCRVSVGGIKGDESYKQKSEIIVASKLKNIAKDYFSKKGIPAQVIKLNGSIELAPPCLDLAM